MLPGAGDRGREVRASELHEHACEAGVLQEACATAVASRPHGYSATITDTVLSAMGFW